MSMTMPPTSAALPPLAVEESGRGEPLVLLHPIGTRAAVWRDIVPLFERRYRVMAIDLPGHGGSDRGPGPLTIDGMAERVHATLAARDALPAHVIGLSMGGMVAQMLQIRSPESVRSLVLCGTSSGVNEAGAAALAKRAATVEAGGIAAIIDETMARWFSESFRQRRPGIADWVRTMLLAGDAQVHADGWRAIAGFRSAGKVTVRPPTLIVYGQLEAAASPATGEALAEVWRAPIVEIDGAAHISPLEDVPGFARIVDRFLSDVSSPTQPAGGN
jgi:3-oxoadipate enol-lactonase